MKFDSAEFWAVSGNGIISLPDHWVPQYAEAHPDMIVFEAELVQTGSFTVTFDVDLSTPEGRLHAERLEAWLSKERYDCPDGDVGGAFNGFAMDLRNKLYFDDEQIDG